ncbi:hypothetical protein H2O73_06080 [Vibrio sp. 404]|uniref:Uncharacterized protein n=1 Tax=Vibrio marinisediminis TaxID=2758441 RepID=A0A7W2FPT3_9VIBR|nr:hypothetical protein [Vibrio marinisediminis]MBA5761914.1 hypothetical protein [Vibrio marinisediminis]
MTRNVISSICILLALIGCGEQDDASVKASSTVEVLFPLVDSLTTASTIEVRGRGTETNLKVNGVAADTTTFASQGFWVANIPLAYGDNQLTVTYTNESGIEQSLFAPSIRRNAYFLERPTKASFATEVDTLYIFEEYSNSFFSLNTLNEQIDFVYQVSVDYFPNENEYQDEMQEQEPESIVVSKDGQSLYYLVVFQDDLYINRLDTASSTFTTIYGPSSPGYTQPASPSFAKEMPLLLDETNNRLVLTNEYKSSILYTLDLALDSPSLDPLPLVNLPTFDQFLYWGIENSTSLTFVAKAGTSYLSGKINLVDGEHSAGSGLQTNLATCPAIETNNSLTYQSSSNTFYWSDDDDSGNICSYDATTHTLEDITASMQGYPDQNRLSSEFLFSTNEHLYISGTTKTDYQLVQFSPGYSGYSYQLVGDSLSIGGNHINPSTARKALLDLESNKVYYIIRREEQNLYSQLYELDLQTQQWREIGTYTGVTFEDGVLDKNNNHLYLINSSSSDELYRVDIETGTLNKMIDPSHIANIRDYQNFTLTDIDIDVDSGLLYLIREVDDAVPSGYDTIGVLTWNIETEVLSNLVSISNLNTDEKLRTGYGMALDKRNNQVVFSPSTGEKHIWAMNLIDGARSIVSNMTTNSGPPTNNTRDLTIDPSKNVLYGVSHNSESLIRIDIATGERSNHSAEDHQYGVILVRPRGIDINVSTQLALVADERTSSLYIVDLLTQQRVIIQH